MVFPVPGRPAQFLQDKLHSWFSSLILILSYFVGMNHEYFGNIVIIHKYSGNIVTIFLSQEVEAIPGTYH